MNDLVFFDSDAMIHQAVYIESIFRIDRGVVVKDRFTQVPAAITNLIAIHQIVSALQP